MEDEVPQIVFCSHKQVAEREKNGDLFVIGTGDKSPFANPLVKEVRQIDSDVACSPYDIWFGMTRRVDGLNNQLQAGTKLIEWICGQIEHNGLDPYGETSVRRLPKKYKQYFRETREIRVSRRPMMDRAGIYLVNMAYHVAINVSTNPEALSAQYGIMPDNEIKYSVVYNPDWGKTSIGANTVHSMPHPSLAMQAFQNAEFAREWYSKHAKQSDELIITNKLNLDVVTALMIMMGYELPEIWVEYVQSLKFGNFDNRPNRSLPDLTPVGMKLTELDREAGLTGSWGGSPTFQGSPRKERTSVTDLSRILAVMSEILPVPFDGAKRSITMVKEYNRE